MSARTIVIGGGPNGLAAATTLARAGKRVTLFEARDTLGGLAAGEEFHPGYRTTGLLHDSAHLRPAVARALELERHGLAFAAEEPARYALEEGGPGVKLFRSVEQTCAGLEVRGAAAAAAYKAWRAYVSRVAGFVASVLSEAPPDLDPTAKTELLDLVKKGVALRRLGEADMLELLRIGPMCVADWVKESFDDPLLQAAMCVPALEGTWLGPWSAGSAALLLAHEATYGRSARGGAAGIVRALETAARAAGVEIALGEPVESIEVDGGAARAVRLASGAAHAADLVLSTLEPKTTLLGLVPRTHLPAELEDAILPWRTRGTTAKVHLALDGPLEVATRPNELVEHFSTGASVDDIERAFDSVKYDTMSERPVLDVRIPSIADPDLAPAGGHVASILVHYVPSHLAGGWTAQAKAKLEERVLDELDRHVPHVRERIVATETLTPADIESRYGIPGGHVHHGEHSLDQLLFLRPSRATGHYRTPIAGLFLGGSGSHPGGGVTGAPGWLAARACARR
ncbi:MAG: NAD(P)/FAD-dependent oxidoreductase [bacterium]|nr:NAD(P)/FAD-dependent oxidoreductase [bacterium]